MTALPTITAQDTYSHIIGASPLTYSWYGATEWSGTDNDDNVNADWSIAVEFYTDIDSADDTETFTVNHLSLMKAIRSIAQGKRNDVSRECVKQCQSLIFKGDAYFDAASADEVLQVATYGDCIYG